MGGHCRQEHLTRSRLCLSQPQVLPWRKLPFGKGWNKARVRSSAGMLKSVEWSACTIPNAATEILPNKHQFGLRDREQWSLLFPLLT